jgi:hypothetical protein
MDNPGRRPQTVVETCGSAFVFRDKSNLWVMNMFICINYTGDVQDEVYIPNFAKVGRTMALGLTQPLTEMSTRNVSWG